MEYRGVNIPSLLILFIHGYAPARRGSCKC